MKGLTSSLPRRENLELARTRAISSSEVGSGLVLLLVGSLVELLSPVEDDLDE